MRDSCDLEPWQFYHERLVRSRRQHRCCETGAVIPRGTRHWRCVGKCAGEPVQEWRQSWAAYRLARALNYTDEGGLACWIPFGGLHEEGGIADREWGAVCRGEITRPPVGDELERLAKWGVEAPPVAAVPIEQEDDDA